MTLKTVLVPAGALVLVLAAYQGYGVGGVAAALGAGVMWVLLHYTRMLQVLRRASNRPIGHVDSAVMLNAKLKAGQPLIHVLALTRALGELRSPRDTQPELYRWVDASGSWVEAEFREGRLAQWRLQRPDPEDA